MNKESLVIAKADYQAVGGEISHDLAAKMVKNHHDKHSMANSYSYVIGKDIMNQLFSQPGCVAVRFFDAINEEGEKTLVYAAIDTNGKTIMEITSIDNHGKLAATPGMVFDQALVDKPFNWFGL